MIIREMFTNPMFDQINNMVRWNGLSRIKDETVGHHTHIVTLFTRIILEELFPDSSIGTDEKNQIINECITYAIFHDFDESFTGDILHNLKYNKHNGEELRLALSSFLQFVREQAFNSGSPFDNMISKYAFNVAIEPYQKAIVKLADWLSMLYYINKERMLGNRNLENQFNGCIHSVMIQSNKVLELLTERFGENFKAEIIKDILNTNFYE